ncbi:MAG TPA: TAXI family TRAP transporter solute-binding subunit [Hyphomicrobiaceae bacterium]|nr:TAXI family TRAP transporter solute-binding subunit [Hyphomicrobiaceae bacterium]
MRVWRALALLMVLCPFLVGPWSAQAQQKAGQSAKVPAFSHPVERQKANENILMFLGGAVGGPWMQMAQEVAQTVADGDNLRVIPLAGEGSKPNLRDVLLLRGIDLGMTRLEVLNGVKATGEFGPNLERRITYIAPLQVDMIQLVARPEIGSLKDLIGKKVNIYPKGSVVTPILKALGIEFDEVNVSFLESSEQMRAGKIFASACFCAVPIPAFRSLSADLGFRLVELPYSETLDQSYVPASMTSETYPNLIPQGAKVQTIGASVVLISYNWPPGTDRYKKIEKFVDAFFSKFDRLRQPSRHPGWREVNIGGNVRGWQRFPAAQQWLDRQAAEAKAKAPAPGVDVTQAPVRSAPSDKAEQERLFREFIEWSRNRPKR